MTRGAHWIDGLRRALDAGEAVVAGCLSGTSADGIDVVLARFHAGDRAPEALAFATRPFPDALGARLRRVLDGGALDLAGVATLDRDLGRAFGEAVARTAAEAAVEVHLVGSHGQTVWHHDGARAGGAASLQLGNGAFVARAAGAPAVTDFRQADLAAGGEGAPLAALADGELFPKLERPALLLNLGGMANLTWLDRNGERGLAFDTGPAGSLLDGLARRLLDRPFDAGGEVASGGRCDERLLHALAEHPYFDRPPPKSTGRDTFGEPWIDDVLARAVALPDGEPSTPDLLATAVELVAWCVAQHLERWVPEGARELVVAGGGVHHAGLMEALARRTALAVRGSAVHGVDPDAREALLFACLARRAVLGVPSTRPWATGAEPGRVLGALHAP